MDSVVDGVIKRNMKDEMGVVASTTRVSFSEEVVGI